MNTLTKPFGSTLGRILMALALSSVIVGLSGGPALGAERHDERGGRKADRYDKRYRHHPRVRVYAPPPRWVYAPPPVYYAPPPPSPGISLFFPIRIR